MTKARLEALLVMEDFDKFSKICKGLSTADLIQLETATLQQKAEAEEALRQLHEADAAALRGFAEAVKRLAKGAE